MQAKRTHVRTHLVHRLSCLAALESAENYPLQINVRERATEQRDMNHSARLSTVAHSNDLSIDNRTKLSNCRCFSLLTRQRVSVCPSIVMQRGPIGHTPSSTGSSVAFWRLVFGPKREKEGPKIGQNCRVKSSVTYVLHHVRLT